MQLGNFKWESTTFNSRLQPTQIALGTTQAAYDVLKLNYDYGSTANNGNIQSQTIVVPTVGSNTGFTATQNYTYDSLNRINDATESVSSTQTWKQTFTYDRFGNRNFDESNTTASAAFPKSCGTSPSFTMCTADKKIYDPAIDTSNNRLSTSDGYTFDASGNTTKDAELRKFTYDAENKQTKVETVNSGGTVTGTLGEYYYDGDGKRVKKVSATETTIFVYDASGKMVAEYSTQLATTPQVSYLTNDHLGSPRINTNENGAVIARHDYQPFGEEIATSQRTTGLNYNADEVRKKFTGYERDDESGLDFAQARMYVNWLGRFTSTDPLFIETKRLLDPQQLNLYSYTKNNPLMFTDPSGMTFNIEGLNDAQKEKWQQMKDVANAKDANGNYINPKLHDEFEKLDKDSRVYNIINTTDKTKGGEFRITKFKGDNDFSEASISFNFDVLKKMDKPQNAETLIKDFKKYDGLFGSNGEILRLAETFGHEAGHAVYAMEHTVDAVKDEKYRLDQENWLASPQDKNHRRITPEPPDLEQKGNFRNNFHNLTEIYAQQQEKLVNNELRNYQKILSQK